MSRANVPETYAMPDNVLDRLDELGVLTPNARGDDADDVAIIAAISRFRAGGYEQALGRRAAARADRRHALKAVAGGVAPAQRIVSRALLRRLCCFRGSGCGVRGAGCGVRGAGCGVLSPWVGGVGFVAG